MLSVREPLKGYELKVGLLPVERIKIPSIQRDISETLVKRLMASIEKVGFVDPILVVESGEDYEVINGQHRLKAAELLGLREVPVIVLPQEAKDYVIALNVEKAPNLKDKAHQAYEIFMKYLSESPDMREYELESKVEEPYYLTVGFITDRFGEKRFPAYAFEKVLKKVDEFLELPLSEAEKERERRAEVLRDVREVMEEKYKELGLTNALHKEAIISKAFQLAYGKRVRKVDDDFYTVFEKIKENIPKVDFSQEELEEF
ncbi:MAG: ParB N-terminal domain-containing protein [Aquificae bacterium]|nr:ParB N-terminal domain-containing protein [Aquificota bacterium]